MKRHNRTRPYLLAASFLLVLAAYAGMPGIEAAVVHKTAAQSVSMRGRHNGKIVFISNRNNVALSIWSMNPDGSSPKRLTDGKSRGEGLPTFAHVYDELPIWSPDGTKIAFISNRDFAVGGMDSSRSIYIMDADGGNVKRILVDGIQERLPEIRSMAWSPDGTRIAFDAGVHGTIPEAKPTTNIYSANTNGTNTVRLTNDTGVINVAPTWSPDAKQMAFSSNRDGVHKIYVMNADGSNQHAIAERGTQPSWSPDGSKILFVGGPGDAIECGSISGNLNCEQLYIVTPNGGNLTQLTHYAASYQMPKWSPDGTKIVFARNMTTLTISNDPRFGGRGITERGHAIFMMNADGSNQTNISNREVGSAVIDAEPDWQPLLAPANQPLPSALGFSAASYSAYKDSGSIQITVTRTGNLREAVSCDYASEGITTPVLPYFAPAFGTLRFAPGETVKTIAVLFADSAYTQPDSFKIRLLNNEGNATFIGGISETTVTVLARNNAPLAKNPIDEARAFVRMQYVDFLNREPDQGGWDYWTNQITNCGSDAKCVNARRIGVSAAFFIEQEFQQTGYFVLRFSILNPVTRSRYVGFSDFMRDVQVIRSGAIGQPDQEAKLEANKTAFIQRYFDDDRITVSFGFTNEQYVDLLFQHAQMTPTQAERDALVNALNAGTETRPRVFRKVLEDERFKRNFFNGAFVLMQYYGYLRREPDQGGYDFWLDVLNSRVPGNYRSMVCAFITSAEYQQRFSPLITRTDAECAQ